jgi:thiol-disulfide isomerase/thioredoxin
MRRDRQARGATALTLLAVAAIASATLSARTLSMGAGQPLPAFTHTAPHEWLNGAPLAVDALRGHVALVHVWAFACVNCYRSMPWLNALEREYRDRGLSVVGVHTPELAQEREPARVAAKVAELGLVHPVMLDADYSYWRALGNEYWPAWYVVDKRGDVRTIVVGEVHAGDRRARAVEGAIDVLLREADANGAPSP